MKYILRSDVLRELREKNKFTIDRLSEIAGLSTKSISRYEHGHSEKKEYSVIDRTIKSLARALKEEPKVLSGKKPIQERPPNSKIPVELSPEVELNYDLVARKYGISRQDILDVAPLLFFMAAEKSLDNQIKEIEISDEPDDEELGEIEQRMAAHANNDIFEASVDEISSFGPFKNNPFTNYLKRKADKPRFKNQVEITNWEHDLHGYTNYSFSQFIPDYTVCTDILNEIILGNPRAKQALKNGSLNLNQIPEKLFEKENAIERAEFIKNALTNEELNY